MVRRKVGNKVVQEIELTPVDKTKTFFKVLVEVDKAQKILFQVKFLKKMETAIFILLTQ